MKKILVLTGALLLPLLFAAVAFREDLYIYSLEDALDKKLIKVQSVTAIGGTDLFLKIENIKRADIKF